MSNPRFHEDIPSKRSRHGLRSQLLLRIAASAHEALGNRLASGGRTGPGEVAAGSHTNSTVDVYAMNGVSVQAKVHFLF